MGRALWVSPIVAGDRASSVWYQEYWEEGLGEKRATLKARAGGTGEAGTTSSTQGRWDGSREKHKKIRL